MGVVFSLPFLMYQIWRVIAPIVGPSVKRLAVPFVVMSTGAGISGGQVYGATTRKLKFGHRGSNHPVIDRRTGVVEVTSQNHGFMVDGDTLPAGEFELTHWSGNDGTLEGMVHRKLPVLACQYHPEASPGPHDARPWFQAFADAIARSGRAGVRRPAVPAVAGARGRASVARTTRSGPGTAGAGDPKAAR